MVTKTERFMQILSDLSILESWEDFGSEHSQTSSLVSWNRLPDQDYPADAVWRLKFPIDDTKLENLIDFIVNQEILEAFQNE